MKIGIIGIGCVGSALERDFTEKNIDVISYDKYKNNGIGTLEDTLECDIIFLCLPTLYEPEIKEYNKSSVNQVCNELKLHDYKGLVVLKSTVEPETTENLVEKTGLKVVHNPEFLTAKTAYEDFKHQDHIVLGYPKQFNKNILNELISFYSRHYPLANFSILTSTESEMMKLGVNTFYSVKIQYFNELYLLSKKLGISYDNVKDTMLKNNWINPMHTQVPGTDGQLSYGGMCFPKDTNALNQFMIRKNSENKVLNATIEERNIIREKEMVETPLEFRDMTALSQGDLRGDAGPTSTGLIQ